MEDNDHPLARYTKWTYTRIFTLSAMIILFVQFFAERKKKEF